MKTGKIIAVYFSGFLVGIALVLFPAAGNIFTSEAFHNLSSAQYGSIFTPQIILAIITALGAPKVANKIGMKKVMLIGLITLFISMILLTTSNFFLKGNIDYWIIMLATAFIGAGFGFTITALNPFAFSLFPGKETSAVTAMHILLGLGTATSSLLLNIFLDRGLWWGAPILLSFFILLVILLTLRLPLSLSLEENADLKVKEKIPTRIWFFALAVFLYGACEAAFGNFGAVFLEKEGGLSAVKASIGLAVFWGSIAIGRIIFTFIALRYSTRLLYTIAPFLVAIVFYLLPSVATEKMLFLFMSLGGLGLSFLFPKSISAATEEYPKYAAFISGALVASIQLGTGFSSNFIGLLNKYHSLGSLMQFSLVFALLLGFLLFYLNYSKKK